MIIIYFILWQRDAMRFHGLLGFANGYTRSERLSGLGHALDSSRFKNSNASACAECGNCHYAMAAPLNCDIVTCRTRPLQPLLTGRLGRGADPLRPS